MTTATAVKEDRQQAFEETVIHDDEQEEFLGRYLNLKTAAGLANKPYRRAHKELKVWVAEHAKNKRVRVGRFIVTGIPIEGGGIDIPEWRSVRPKVEQA